MKFTQIIVTLFLLIFGKINPGMAQKTNIDSNAYAHWNSVGGASISSTGKYVFYTIENEPVNGHTLVIQSSENNWKKGFKDAVKNEAPLISKGGDYAVFLNEKDNLIIISLGKDLVRHIPNVSSFSMCPNEKSEWIAYQLIGSKGEIVLQNLNTGEKEVYKNVINTILGDDGQTVILQIEKTIEEKPVQELRWIDLKTGKNMLIWKGLQAQRVIIDSRYPQLAFISEKGLCTYNLVTNKLSCLINNEITSLDSGLKFEGIKRFSNDGLRLFIELKQEDKHKLKAGLVEVWSYLDHKLQTEQQTEIEARTYVAVVNLNDNKVIRLEQEFENLAFNSFENGSADTIGLITRGDRNNGDWYNINKQSDYLISLKNGKRILLKYSPEGLSPGGKYLVYFDTQEHTYISYNTKTGVSKTISNVFSENPIGQNFGRPGRGIAGWLENDEGLLFYDNYDIWRMDLSGQKTPVKLTAGYGEIHHLVFSIVYGQYYSYPLCKTQKIILTAFDLESKRNGFYSLELDKVNVPKLLSMGDYLYSAPGLSTIDFGGLPPIKAKKAEVYVVSRMSAKEAPNYFITKDFKTFKDLSHVHPESKYNWYTTELHNWMSLDGKRLQGVLYKPENFDPAKKYPVIFYYYEQLSNNLNAYLNAGLTHGPMNIPTYVSNGYLVFCPDIYYILGDPMQGTYDAVVSAARYVSNLSFVDPKKMGIQGNSWGGIQTNYLVTHTNLFAAACSASGFADWIANYGRLSPSGYSRVALFENGQNRMRKSIWEIPDAYIKTSPIFRLDKVTTPFLIMHTKNDAVCPYEDALELFIGLRRLGKRSWLLAYPDANHGVDGKQAQDYSTRMMQFFDHYLKDKPAPVWMTQGVPAERRGLDNGLAYDTKIKTPGPGLLTADEQRKVDSIMIRKPIMIQLK